MLFCWKMNQSFLKTHGSSFCPSASTVPAGKYMKAVQWLHTAQTLSLPFMRAADVSLHNLWARLNGRLQVQWNSHLISRKNKSFVKIDYLK